MQNADHQYRGWSFMCPTLRCRSMIKLALHTKSKSHRYVRNIGTILFTGAREHNFGHQFGLVDDVNEWAIVKDIVTLQ